MPSNPSHERKSRLPRRQWQATIRPHWIEVCIALALIAVGMAQVGIYLRQAAIMQTQTDILSKQTDISIAADRAFVNFEPVDVISIDTGPAGPGKVVGIFFNVVNSGGVSTKEFQAVTECKPVLPADTKSDPFDFFVWDKNKVVNDVIGPKQKGGIGHCDVSPDDIPKIQFSKVFMYLLAEVRYRDLIDPKSLRKTRFSRQFYVSAVHTDEEGIVHFYNSTQARGQNNCADEDCPK